MRISPLAIAIGLLAGCGPSNLQPVNLSGPAATPAATTADCVRGELQELGYEIQAPQSTTTSITGLRVDEPPWYLRVLGYRATVDQITATVNQGRLEVLAISSGIDEPAGTSTLASEAAAQDARELLEECRSGS